MSPILVRHRLSSGTRARVAVAAVLVLVAGLLGSLPASATHQADYDLPLTSPLTSHDPNNLDLDCAAGSNIAAVGSVLDSNDTNLAVPPDRFVSGSNNRAVSGSSGIDAIWANATAYNDSTTLDISGSDNVISGRVVSRSNLKIGGARNQFQHGTEYGLQFPTQGDKGALELTGQDNCFTGPDPDGGGPDPAGFPDQVPRAPSAGPPDTFQPQGFPVNFDPDGDDNFAEHFAPTHTLGGNPPAIPPAVLAALNDTSDNGEGIPHGINYFVCPDDLLSSMPVQYRDGILANGEAGVSPFCDGSDLKGSVQGSDLDNGLYYVEGKVDLSASDLTANVTLVSLLQLKVAGSNESEFIAYSSNLLFMGVDGTPNTTDGEDAVKVEGSTSKFDEGHIFAPNGRVELAGSQNSFNCTVMGDRVRLNGQLLNISTEGCAEPQPNIRVVKTGNGTVTAGQTTTFQIDIINDGPGPATNVTTSPPDTLPDGGLDWVLGNQGLLPGGTGGSACTLSAADVLSCTIATLAEGATYRVNVSAVTSADDCGDVPNTVTVAADNEDPARLGDNTSSATNVVQCPDINVTKTGNGTIAAGQTAQFTIDITNLGPGAAENVTTNPPDTLPDSGLDWVLGNQGLLPGGTGGSSCTLSAADVLSCTIASLAQGATYRVIVTAVTSSDDCGDVPNTVTVSATNEDPAKIGPDNTDSDTIVVTCGALQITKTAKHKDDSGETSPNLVATFTIVDSEGNTHLITTNSSGFGCADGLAIGTTTSITETTVPDNYSAPTIANVNVPTGTCANGTLASGGVIVNVENTPLTDVEIIIDSQQDGATETTISCWKETSDPDTDPPDFGPVVVSDGSLDMNNLPPGFLTCKIDIDP